MNRFELWVLAGVAWWTTAMLAAFALSAAWSAATGDPTVWLVAGVILPLPVVAGVVASGITRDAREDQ